YVSHIGLEVVGPAGLGRVGSLFDSAGAVGTGDVDYLDAVRGKLCCSRRSWSVESPAIQTPGVHWCIELRNVLIQHVGGENSSTRGGAFGVAPSGIGFPDSPRGDGSGFVVELPILRVAVFGVERAFFTVETGPGYRRADFD